MHLAKLEFFQDRIPVCEPRLGTEEARYDLPLKLLPCAVRHQLVHTPAALLAAGQRTPSGLHEYQYGQIGRQLALLAPLVPRWRRHIGSQTEGIKSMSAQGEQI